MTGALDQRRRRIQRRLRRIMAGPDGGRCSLCRREFCTGQSVETTYGGITKEGRVALVGACCFDELAEVLTGGVFLSNSSEEPAWQKDDAAWFRQHPQRTHRLRLAFPGELVRWPKPIDHALLGRTDHFFVVRRIQSGLRQRMPSLWLKGAVLPESEEFAHALADFLSQSANLPEGTLFSGEHIEALARRYTTGEAVS